MILYCAVNVDATVQLAEIAAQQVVQRSVFVNSVKSGGGALTGKCVNESNQVGPEEF